MLTIVTPAEPADSPPRRDPSGNPQAAGQPAPMTALSRQQREVGLDVGEPASPTLAEYRARCLLAQSLLGHQACTLLERQVLAILRGEVDL